MAFKASCICTLWANKQTGKVVTAYEGKSYVDIRVSTSKKNKQTNQYETDFSGNVRCFGHAKEVLESVVLNEKDKVKLLEVEVSNHYDPTKRTTYTSFTCWDLELVDPSTKAPKQPEVVGGDLPFEPLDDNSLPF